MLTTCQCGVFYIRYTSFTEIISQRQGKGVLLTFCNPQMMNYDNPCLLDVENQILTTCGGDA